MVPKLLTNKHESQIKKFDMEHILFNKNRVRILEIFLFTLTLVSCMSKGNKQGDAGSLQKDSAFLEIKGDLLDPAVLWSNKDTYTRALYRLEKHLRVEKNRFKWDIKQGADVNISENLFEYIIYNWKFQNKELENGNALILRSKIDGRYFAVPKINEQDTTKWGPPV